MKERTSSIDTLFIVVLLCAFTASVLMVLLLGAQVYGSASKTASAAYARRTCAAYINEKLRHGDLESAVETGEFDGCSALMLTMDTGGASYSDILYYCDGWLWELTCEKGARFTRADGVKIVETGPVVFSSPKPGLIKAEITEQNGGADGLVYALRSGGTA